MGVWKRDEVHLNNAHRNSALQTFPPTPPSHKHLQASPPHPPCMHPAGHLFTHHPPCQITGHLPTQFPAEKRSRRVCSATSQTQWTQQYVQMQSKHILHAQKGLLKHLLHVQPLQAKTCGVCVCWGGEQYVMVHQHRMTRMMICNLITFCTFSTLVFSFAVMMTYCAGSSKQACQGCVLFSSPCLTINELIVMTLARHVAVCIG